MYILEDITKESALFGRWLDRNDQPFPIGDAALVIDQPGCTGQYTSTYQSRLHYSTRFHPMLKGGRETFFLLCHVIVKISEKRQALYDQLLERKGIDISNPLKVTGSITDLTN